MNKNRFPSIDRSVPVSGTATDDQLPQTEFFNHSYVGITHLELLRPRRPHHGAEPNSSLAVGLILPCREKESAGVRSKFSFSVPSGALWWLLVHLGHATGDQQKSDRAIPVKFW
jgi:hypothetical protein